MWLNGVCGLKSAFYSPCKSKCFPSSVALRLVCRLAALPVQVQVPARARRGRQRPSGRAAALRRQERTRGGRRDPKSAQDRTPKSRLSGEHFIDRRPRVSNPRDPSRPPDRPSHRAPRAPHDTRTVGTLGPPPHRGSLNRPGITVTCPPVHHARSSEPGPPAPRCFLPHGVGREDAPSRQERCVDFSLTHEFWSCVLRRTESST